VRMIRREGTIGQSLPSTLEGSGRMRDGTVDAVADGLYRYRVPCRSVEGWMRHKRAESSPKGCEDERNRNALHHATFYSVPHISAEHRDRVWDGHSIPRCIVSAPS
jgi:hypothetical protein